MFYSSDPKRSNHDNYLAPSEQDKYSSIRVLDQTHKSIKHSLSETNIFSNFSSQFKNDQQTERGVESKSRPHSTIDLRRGTFPSNDEKKAKSLKVNRSNKNADPFADILHTVRQSLDLTSETSANGHPKGSLASIDTGFSSKETLMLINSESASKPDIELPLSPVEVAPMSVIDTGFSSKETLMSINSESASKPDIELPLSPVEVAQMSGTEPAVSDINCSEAQGDVASPPSNIEPAFSDTNWSAVKGEVIPIRKESRVSSPRYHALSEDELEEELREEDEVRSRNDSVVLRHEIIRSYSITENLAPKTSKDDAKILELDETDGRKGYVQLRYDDSGMLWEDDFDEPSSDDKLSKDVDITAPADEEHSFPGDDMPPNDSSLSRSHLKDAPNSSSDQDHKILSTGQENASKRFTVDVGELRRQSDGRPIPSRPKHISISGGTVREIKFLRSPPSRVSTLFSTKLPEIRSPDKQKGGQKGKQPIEPGFVFFGDGLFDFTEERNEEAVAFSTVVGELRSKLCGKLDLNLGYLLSPTVTQNSNSLVETLEEVSLSLEIFIEGQESPVLINCSSKTQVSEVVAQVLQTVWKQEVNPSSIIDSAFTLKVCGFQEYLCSVKLLCEYEYVHQCVMARQSVRLALLDSDQVPRTLARSEMDDIADCEPRIYSQFFDRPLDTSVSREGLSVLRQAFEDELKRVLQDADSPNPRFQPGRLVQSVRAVCTTLGQIETKGIVNYVFSLKEMKRRYDEACQGSPTAVTVDLVELRNLLQNVFKHVYLVIELYCNTFNTDFGRIRISEKIINGSIEVTAMTDQFSVYIPAAYRIPPDWKEKFETYIVEGRIYYGGNLLSVPERTSVLGEIRTNFFPQISWQCWMTFGIEIRKLPRESKLCLTLYGLSPVAKNGTMSPAQTPLGWTAVQLFDFNGVLVSGSQLFGLWPNQAANPLGTCTSNLIDKRSAILQIDFTRHLSDIVFPALKIPEAETDTSDVGTTEMFNKFLSKDMFEDLRPEDIHMIWQNRRLASKVPSMLPLVLSSVPDWTYQNLPEIYQLLANWTPMSPVDAMVLLKVQFPDRMVRGTAVQWMECFSDDELCDYLPQLVQALKYESYHNSPLARFLIERGLRSSRLIHYLFWHIKDNIVDPQFGQRYQVILGGLLSVCGSLQREQFTKQDELVTRLTEVAEKVKKSKENLRDEVLRSELEKVPQETLERLRLPLNPGVEVTAILADECSYFNSNSVPLRLLFKNSDMHGFKIDTMYKVGDDLRQDALTMQLIGIMNKLWLKEGLDLKMVTYRCLPTGSEIGMVELVQDAQTLREIQTEYGLAGSFKDEPLARWLLKHNPIEKEYGEAVNNFISSCAGYCVATYVIGICDRHNDNIMVKKTGHLFHIDFSKFLGRSQMFGSFRRDRSPFVLTSDMAYVINGGCTPTSRFQDFVDLCCRAFNIIRHHTNLFLNLLSLMLNSGIPYLRQTNDLKYVYDVLLPQATDLEATTIFTRQIESSLASRFTQVNFFIHNMAQIRHSSQMKDDDSVMPVLSFSPHTYSMVTDSKITSARVVDYQKRYTPDKYYVYLINVCREDESKPTFVFRRFSHFHEFNAKLADQFPRHSFPKLPGKIYLGRSQIRMVAEKRRQDFDQYLQALLSLEDINCSKLFYTFLHSLASDDIDVKKYAIRLLPEERYPRDRRIGGEVKVSISFSSCQLNIMIMHARNLLPKSAGNLSDPYVKIYLTPDPTKSTKRKTKIARRTLNPTYNETFVWVISEEELRKREIRITVWDYDVLTENELMGGVLIDPSDYDFSNQFVGWFTLTDLKGN